MRSKFDRNSYVNGPEDAFLQMAKEQGWEVTKRGWPDFFCIDSHGMFAVEVKPLCACHKRVKKHGGSKFQVLKISQARCMDFLISQGIRCYVSDGITMEPYKRDEHALEARRYRKDPDPYAKNPPKKR